jgi:hypothetical protein
MSVTEKVSQIQVGIKLQYVPLPKTIDWTPILKAHKSGTLRNVLKITKCMETTDGETFYEIEVEGHELESYYIKIIENKYGFRGSCHCRDFECRKLPAFRSTGNGQWCKHLLAGLVAIKDLKETSGN